MERLVLIGNGMAGVHCIEQILKINPRLYEITIFGTEPHVNYNRILLSSVLQGSTTFKDITLHDRSWYEKHQIQLYCGETVSNIDTAKKMIQTDKGRKVQFDKLILATGSEPFLPPIPGANKEGVLTFRTIEDCQKMIDSSKTCKKAAVIGGGLLGLEAARGLLNLGMEVEVIHINQYLMERQLDETASKMLQRELEKQGMKFLLNKESKAIIGEGRVEGVSFKDGTQIKADLVVMAVGVRPNIQLAKESGIETNRAIVVNDYLQTSTPDIYAVGECVEHRGSLYGLVKPLFEQGKVLAKHICHKRDQSYQGSIMSAQSKVSGVEVFSIGQFQEDGSRKSVKVFDDLNHVYKKLVFQGNKLVSAVFFGDTKEANQVIDLIAKEKDVSELEKVSLLKPSKSTNNIGSNLENNDIICHCNHVTKGTIIEAVQTNGLLTVEDVKKCTKATSTCGGCKSVVSELLCYLDSDECNEVMPVETLCDCTGLTEDEVISEIVLHGLSSLKEVREILNWRKKQGCSRCIPALNYYFEMIYPEFPSRQKKSLITINTCKEEEYCRCDKQESNTLANDMKLFTEKVLTPNRMKVGISACIHNGADATTKDIGLIKIDRGWEIYVGGSSGRDVRAGKLLCIAETKQEAFELIVGFIQYYRGTGNYLERTWQWIERIGLVHIREVLFVDELRQQLVKQLRETATCKNDELKKSTL